jgi:4-amino-4-deoxy-L-arabinose transferase-like glycosyltransferase
MRIGILILILLLGLAMAFRLAYVLPKDASPASLSALPDQEGYVQCARNWWSGDGLYYHDDRFGQDVYAVRTPGYPVFLALCNNVSVRLVRIVQALIDVSCVVAVYLVGRRMWSESAGLVAAAWVACDPFMIYFSSLLLSETLFTAMLAWSLYLIICRRWMLLACVLLALGAMVRPSSLPLALILPVAGAWLLGLGFRRIVACGFLSLLITVVVFAPWAYRNHLMLGSWVWTTTNSGITAYDGLHPGATGASDQAFVQSMPELGQMNEVERDTYLANLARRFVREHPGKTLQLALVKAVRTWSPVPLSQQFGESRLHVLVGLAYSLPLFFFALLGFLAATKGVLLRPPLRPTPELRAAAILLVMPALCLTVIHAASVGSLRYRIPVDPQLAILAGAGVWGWRRNRRQGAAAETA